MRARSLVLTSAVIALLLAAWLRFFRIEYQSYWNDEGNSLSLAGRDAGTIVRSAAADIHPPGYYLALKVWAAATGTSELALRGFSALAGVVGVALLYRLGKEYFGPAAGVLAALAGAFNPFLVYYSQEARMYALLATLSAASFLLFTRWLRSSRPPAPPLGDRRLGLAYSLATAAALYTHYAFGLVLLAQNVAALGGLLAHGRGGKARLSAPPTDHASSSLQRSGAGRNMANASPIQIMHDALPAWQSRLLAWLLYQALALALFLPWAPTAYRQLTTWPAAREFQPFGAALLDLSRYLAFGRTLPTPEALAGLAGVAVLLLFGLRRRGQTITPLLWLLVPAALTLGFGLLSEPFAKFLLVAVPALCLLVGQGLAAVPVDRRRTTDDPFGRRTIAGGARSYNSETVTPHASLSPQRSGAGRITPDGTRVTQHALLALAREGLVLVLWLAALGACLAATYASLNNLYFNPAYFRDDYRGIARYVEGLARPADALILIAPNQVEAFGYYHRSGAPIYPLPAARPLDPQATDAALAGIAAQHSRLFVLYWGDEQADPEHRVERWLNTHTFKAGEAWYGQVRLATYAVATPAAAPTVLSGARFGDQIALEGYDRPAGPLAPGDILPVTLFWRTDAPLAERYKVFVHLYADPNQPPAAQQDGEPGGGQQPTTTWTPGAVVADLHGVLIPPDLPPGDYQVMVGLYNLFTGQRLAFTLEGSAPGDRLSLGNLTIQ